MTPAPAAFAAWLRQAAQSHGALDAGCLLPSSLDLDALRHRFAAWLDSAGNRGRLRYLESSLDRRLQPFTTRPWARNALVLCFPGQWGQIESMTRLPPARPGKPAGFVSLYACGEDYHRTGQRMLENLAGALRAEFAGGNDVRVEPCVDTRAVPEVFFAVTAGLGLLGRNSLLRTARHGSRVFIGVLFTDLALPEVRHMVDVPPACTTCGGCIRNCPTGALGADGLVQLGRCRSYLSMEYKGEFSPEQTGLLGDCLFGCDGCTAQCPPDTPPGSQIAVDLEQLLAAPDAAIAEWIHGSALEYIGPARLKRNAAACMRGVTRPR